MPNKCPFCAPPNGGSEAKAPNCSGEPGTLLYSSGFQIAFLGASALCGHQSEAEGNGEENRGGRELGRGGWGFLPQVNQSSSALNCLISWGMAFANSVLFLKRV